ncbi:MAG: hypothetical protein ACKOV8_12630, partial [Phycisphaerales bacterium]
MASAGAPSTRAAEASSLSGHMHRSMPRATLLALAISGVASMAVAQVPLPPARRPAPSMQPAASGTMLCTLRGESRHAGDRARTP